MRRLLSIFLLALMLVQFSWALAASYCQHETGAVEMHVGHHEHKHRQAGETTNSGQESKVRFVSLIDADCNVCHACSPAVAACAVVVAASFWKPLFAPRIADLSLSAPSPRPERPNWVALA